MSRAGRWRRAVIDTLLLAAAVAACLIIPAASVAPDDHPVRPAEAAGQADLDWVRSSQYRQTVGSLSYRPAASGAYGINANWERGASGIWYVSQQEAGADLIAKGISSGRTADIDTGLLMFDWAFAHQQPDGSFEPAWGGVHASRVITAALFTASAARGLLLLERSEHGPAYAARIDSYKPKLAATVNWMTSPPQWSAWTRHVDGATGYGVFLHQHYAGAAAILLTSRLTGDTTHDDKAVERARWALARQAPQGWNTEIDGPDTGYGAIGFLHAYRLAVWAPDHQLAADLHAMVARGVGWAAAKIAPDGWIDWAGNTRTCVPREGMKDPGYSTLSELLGAWGLQRARPDLFAPAAAALQYARTAPDRRCESRASAGPPPGPAPGGAPGGAGGEHPRPATQPAALPATAGPVQAPVHATPGTRPARPGQVATCRAPRLTGLTLKRAKRKLRKRCPHVRVRVAGRPHRAADGAVKVRAQNVKPGRSMAAAGTLRLTVRRVGR